MPFVFHKEIFGAISQHADTTLRVNNQSRRQQSITETPLILTSLFFNMLRASAYSRPSPSPEAAHLHGSPMLGPPLTTAHLQQAVQMGLDEYRGEGSKVAYDSCRQEYREFCESLYPNDEFKFLVNDEKAFFFIFYTAMREQKPRGGKRKRPGEVGTLFNRADYDAVLERYAVWWDTDNTSELPHPTNPVGIESLTHYKAGVKAEWDYQCSMNSNSLPWHSIWTQRSKRIVENVKRRKGSVRAANFGEKLAHEFAPYLAVARYPDMEKEMWERSDSGNRFAFAWLRNRMCLLFTTSAILRCESLFRAELSDFLSIKFQAPKDVHPMHAVVMQIMKGKFLSNVLLSLCFWLSQLTLRCFLRAACKRQIEPGGQSPVRPCYTPQACRAVLHWFVCFLFRVSILFNK